jgi:hypothetical protein
MKHFIRKSALMPRIFDPGWLILGVFFAVLGSSVLAAQDAGYQRYNPERKKSELILEGSVNTWVEDISGFDLFSARMGLKAEYIFLTNHTVTLNLPYTINWHNNPDSPAPWMYAFGDMVLSYEYLKKFGHIHLFFGPRFGIPLYQANDYMSREGIYAPGDRRYSAGFSVSATGVRDPVVWNVGFLWDVGLPKTERFFTSWQPGNIQIAAGFSDLFNDRFGFSLGLTQLVSLPQISGGKWKIEDLSAVAAGEGEFLMLFEKDYVRVSLEVALYPLNRPFVLGLVYGHQFDLSKNLPLDD